MGRITQELHAGEEHHVCACVCACVCVYVCADAPLSFSTAIGQLLRGILCLGVCRTLGNTRRATTLCRPLKGSRFPSSSLVTSISSWRRWHIPLQTHRGQCWKPVTADHSMITCHRWSTPMVSAVTRCLNPYLNGMYFKPTYWSVLLLLSCFPLELHHKLFVLLFPAEAKQRSLWPGRRWGVHHAWGIRIPQKVCKDSFNVVSAQQDGLILIEYNRNVSYLWSFAPHRFFASSFIVSLWKVHHPAAAV